jgi:hypothetical protein
MLRRMAEDSSPRIYRFAITVTVDPGDPSFDDPEWVADAAAGVLSNVYGYDCVYEDIELLAPR